MDQMTLELVEVTEEAIERARAHAHAAWLLEAEFVIKMLAATGRAFTTDDAWFRLDKSGHTTHEPRALGAVMRDFVRGGQIVHTGEYWPSERRECHRRPVAVWIGR